MLNRNLRNPLSEFLRFLANHNQNECERLPSLPDISNELGASISVVREQMEVARAMGLIDARPRTGIRCLPYSFRPTISTSLAYANALSPTYFQQYSDLRNHLEGAYWFQAVQKLTPEDHARLRQLVNNAKAKLNRNPIVIPQEEHRNLHLTIYHRLENVFVTGLLEAYWELYEEAGMDVYTDLAYYQVVWNYHGRMVEAICAGDFNLGHQILLEHMDLIYRREKPSTRQRFE